MKSRKIIKHLTIATILSIPLLIGFMIYYYNQVNIIEPVHIQIKSDSLYIKNLVNVTAVGPLGRKFNIDYNYENQLWDTKDYYLNRIEIKIPMQLMSNNTIILYINNKMIFNSNEFVTKDINSITHDIILYEIKETNFYDKTIFFAKMFTNRLIFVFEVKVKKFITVLVYLFFIIYVFKSIRQDRQKNQSV
ncbi:MAG: hypothetical protein WCP69_01830 [Bacteroidota bacterium]